MSFSSEAAQIHALNLAGQFAEALVALDALAERKPEISSLGEFCVLRMAATEGLGRWNECAELGSRGLASHGTQIDDAHRATIHGLLGIAHTRLGEPRRAEQHLRAAIHILTWDLKDQGAAIRQRRRLALMFHGLGLWRQAEYESESAIELADEHAITRESGALRLNLAVTLAKSGELSRVPEVLNQADRFLAAAGIPKWQMQSALIRASFFRITGHTAKALELLKPALQSCREHQYSREEVITLEYTGDCQLALRNYRPALELYNEGMRIAEATAPKGDLVPELCHRIAECLTNLGNPNDAILFCERGLRQARDIGDRYEECATHRVLAMAHRAAGNPTKALRIADEGIELGRGYEIPYELALTLAWTGEIHLTASALDDQALGRKHLWEARGLFARLGLRQFVEEIDRSLGYELPAEPISEAESLSTVADLEEVDRGALRFGLVTCNRHVREAVATVQSIAPSMIPVLISGESGVGKELLARAVHQMSDRRKGPFVAVNCGGIASGLLESEMFGHERGAFTGAVSSREGLIASADKGTLFLDEIADLPLPAQASLLRVLESGEVRPLGKDDLKRVDIRIVAATNGDLEDFVARGVFRQDLFFRLNGVRVTLPPLRDREEDVRVLFRYFWAQACSAAKKTLRVAPDVEPMLAAYEWPGNVRELRHEIARVVALAPDASLVTPEHFLPGQKRKDAFTLRRGRVRREALDIEREEILTALRAHGGNKAEAARSLGGMKRTTLIYKMERLGIRPEEYDIQE
jgi:DNA-binding NtrC family response regulator/tetratricopeptide (TPR) repeat protein